MRICVFREDFLYIYNFFKSYDFITVVFSNSIGSDYDVVITNIKHLNMINECTTILLGAKSIYSYNNLFFCKVLNIEVLNFIFLKQQNSFKKKVYAPLAIASFSSTDISEIKKNVSDKYSQYLQQVMIDLKKLTNYIWWIDYEKVNFKIDTNIHNFFSLQFFSGGNFPFFYINIV